MTVNRMYHPPSDIDSLYMPRMEGGQRLLGMAECVETEEQNLSLYLVQLEEKLLSFSKSKRILRNKQKKEERHKQWKEKQLHGKFVRETEEVRIEETREWIRKGYLKKETEGLIFITQEQALRARWIRKNIDDQEVSEKCRMYGKRDESITHLIAQCKKLTQKEYKQRHNSIARILHFFKVGKFKWYNHKPASAVENDRVEILWDFNIQTDHVIQHRRPDIVALYKTEKKCCRIDIAVPGDKRIELKEQQKVVNYSEIRR